VNPLLLSWFPRFCRGQFRWCTEKCTSEKGQNGLRRFKRILFGSLEIRSRVRFFQEAFESKM